MSIKLYMGIKVHHLCTVYAVTHIADETFHQNPLLVAARHK